MIIDERYETASDQYFGVGIPAGTYTEENTARVHGFSPLTQEAYWLGYIAYDNLPMVMRHCRKASDSDNYIVMEDTVVDNYPCGYIADGDSTRIYIENGSYVNAQYLNAPRFVNNLHPEYNGFFVPSNLSDADSPSLYFLHYLTLGGSVVPKSYSSFMSGQLVYFNNTHNDGLLGMLEFMQGNRSITLSVTEDNVTYTFDLEMDSQLAETGSTQVVSNEYSDAVLTVFLNYVRLPQTWYINGDTCGARGYNFSAKVKYDNGEEIIGYNVCLGAMSYAHVTPIILWYKSVYDNDIQRFNAHSLTYYDGGGFTGTFSKTEVDGLSETTGYLFNGNLVVWGRNNRREFAQVITGDDLYRMFALMFRVDTTQNSTVSTATYVDGITYATDVDKNDQFLARLKTGNITDPTFKDGLRKWQYSSILADIFDEDEIPPYEPEPEPGPTPQETEPKYPGFPTLGPSTRYIPTAGVNFYALNSSLVTDFVQRLWSQPKSFYEAIQIAGNQVDSIFDYIQSFRYYPLKYDFSSEDSYPVIFGTGAVLKEANGDTNFQLRGTPLIQNIVTAGEWNLNASIYHWRNNFLDYSPYLKMSIYLPFAGTIELSPEAVASHTDISAATISLLASFDIETGTITYYVVNQANVILAQKTAKVAIDLPLSGNNSAEQSASILRAQFSTIKQLLGAGSNIVSGAATSGLVGAAAGAVSTLGSLGDMYLQNSLAQRAIPVEVQGMGGTFSALAGGQYPYITINRQKVSNPPNYAHTTGYLVEGTYRISSLNGLTVCRNVDVSGIGQATDKEKAEIKKILESGFYA